MKLFRFYVLMCLLVLLCGCEFKPSSSPTTDISDPSSGTAASVSNLEKWGDHILRASVPNGLSYVVNEDRCCVVSISGTDYGAICAYSELLKDNGYTLYAAEWDWEEYQSYDFAAKSADGIVVHLQFGSVFSNLAEGQACLTISNLWSDIENLPELPPNDGEWGTNKFEQQLPEPNVPYTKGTTNTGHYAMSLPYMDYDAAKAYVSMLQDYGFSRKLTLEDDPLQDELVFGAENEIGYYVYLMTSYSPRYQQWCVSLLLYSPEDTNTYFRLWNSGSVRGRLPAPVCDDWKETRLLDTYYNTINHQLVFYGMDKTDAQEYAASLYEYGYKFKITQLLPECNFGRNVNILVDNPVFAAEGTIEEGGVKRMLSVQLEYVDEDNLCVLTVREVQPMSLDGMKYSSALPE